MSFDPTLPLDAAKVQAFVLRDQLNALNDKIDAVPAGPVGPEGPQGPPFAGAIVDAMETLEPDEPGTAESSFDGTNVHFTFALPRGAVGPQGPQGDPGGSGGDGPPGPPGDVNMGELTGAIAGTSANSNGVATLDDPFTNDPPTLADLELHRAKLNELITALRR